MERNFWEEGTSVKVNFGEHLNLFLRNKGTTVNFHREQGNMHPPPWEALFSYNKLGTISCCFMWNVIPNKIRKNEKRNES